MNIEQSLCLNMTDWQPKPPGILGERAQLVLIFGGTSAICSHQLFDTIRLAYPNAYLMGCSTAGEIFDVQVFDNTLSVTAIEFESTRVHGTGIELKDVTNSYQAGVALSKKLTMKDLVHVFVLSEGLHVNGSELVSGLTENLAGKVTVTGGLSGDGDRFQETFVIQNSSAKRDTISVIGLYGSRTQVGYASLGGWDPFGPERLITRSDGNILYEMDGKSALALYKKYLGEHAQGLPATGLLFPLTLRGEDDETGVVRTILAVNEDDQSMTFAGDVPVGCYARLMKANFNRLVDGAAGAARTSWNTFGATSPELAILISCVGRKMVLKQRIEEEVEAVREVLGTRPVLTGFYSYGEISPFTPSAKCELHNQTMTITTIAEG